VEIEVLSDAKENFPSRGASDANAKLSTPVQI